MRCWLCGTEEQNEFTKYKCRFICDSCMAVLNYHYNEALKEIQGEHETPENEFNEALVEYADYKCDEYNEQLRKERRG